MRFLPNLPLGDWFLYLWLSYVHSLLGNDLLAFGIGMNINSVHLATNANMLWLPVLGIGQIQYCNCPGAIIWSLLDSILRSVRCIAWHFERKISISADYQCHRGRIHTCWWPNRKHCNQTVGNIWILIVLTIQRWKLTKRPFEVNLFESGEKNPGHEWDTIGVQASMLLKECVNMFPTQFQYL